MHFTDKVADAIVGLLKIKYETNTFYFADKIKKTMFQRVVLSKIYNLSNFPSTETRDELAIIIGLPMRSVQIWFQNRRQQSRKSIRDHHSKIGKLSQLFIDNYRVPTRKLVEIAYNCYIEIHSCISNDSLKFSTE